MRRWGWLVLSSLASSLGCTGETPYEPPLIVERWDRARQCFVTCTGSADRPDVPELFDAVCEDDITQDCTFEGGWEDLRLTVDYDHLVFPSKAPPPPKATFVFDDGNGTTHTLPRAQPYEEPQPDPPPEDPPPPRWLAQGRITTPVDRQGSFSLRVDLGGDAFVPSSTFTIRRPGIDFVFEDCADASNVDCPREAGVGSIFVEATAPPNLTITTLETETQLAGASPTEGPKGTFVDRGDRKVARAFIPVADFPDQAWTVAARVAGETESRTYSLVPAPILVSVPRCEDAESCSFPAGVGTALVRVLAPTQATASKAILIGTLDGLPISTDEVTLTSNGTNKVGDKEITIPTDLGAWTLTATVGASRGQHAPIDLRPPTDITLYLGDGPEDELCSGAISPPSRAVLEPNDACRELRLCVVAPDRQTSGEITLATNMGRINGSESMTTIMVGAEDRAVIEFVLPDALPSQDRLRIEASSGVVPGEPLIYDLQPVAAIGPGTLSAPDQTVTVGESGSPAVVLTGQLPLPAGASFFPGTRVQLRVAAEPAVVPVGVPCGNSISDAAIDCDPTDPGPTGPGGCVLAPLEVEVASNGSYAVPLAAGVCFEGTIQVTALGAAYSENLEECLGDRPIVSPVQVGQTPALVYEP